MRLQSSPWLWGLFLANLAGCGAVAGGETDALATAKESLRPRASEGEPVVADPVDPRTRPVRPTAPTGPTPPEPTSPPSAVVPAPDTGVATSAGNAQPLFADLALDHTLRIFDAGPLGLKVHIDVTNIGEQPAVAPATGGIVSVGQAPCSSATLQQYPDGSETFANTLNAGAKGYLLTYVAADLLDFCQDYQVSIDLNHNMQFEQNHSGVFLNDTGLMHTQCLTWTTPITSLELGYEPDSHLKNRNLQEIVGGYVSVRDHGEICSDCHYRNSPKVPAYYPDIAEGQTFPVMPRDLIDGRQWTGSSGWAVQFGAHPDKPAYMRDLLTIWAAYGWH